MSAPGLVINPTAALPGLEVQCVLVVVQIPAQSSLLHRSMQPHQAKWRRWEAESQQGKSEMRTNAPTSLQS